MTKLEECEAALRKTLLAVYGVGLTGDDLSVSRAVLMALREPDNDMEEAGNMALSNNGLDSVEGDDSSTCFTAMIDAVLRIW